MNRFFVKINRLAAFCFFVLMLADLAMPAPANSATQDDETLPYGLALPLFWLSEHFNTINLSPTQANDFHLACIGPDNRLSDTIRGLSLKPKRKEELRPAKNIHEKTDRLRRRIARKLKKSFLKTTRRAPESVKKKLYIRGKAQSPLFTKPCTPPRITGIKKSQRDSQEYAALSYLGDLQAHAAVVEEALESHEGNCGEIARFTSFITWIQNPDTTVGHLCMSGNSKYHHALTVVNPQQRPLSRRLYDWAGSLFADPWGAIKTPANAVYNISSLSKNAHELLASQTHAFHTICPWGKLDTHILKRVYEIDLSQCSREFKQFFADEVERIVKHGRELISRVEEGVLDSDRTMTVSI